MKKCRKRIGYRKTVLSLLLVAVMLLGMCPQIAFAATEVTLSFKNGVAQDAASRYLLYFEKLPDTTDKYWNNNTVYIDGKEVSGEGVHYLHLDEGFALLLSYNVIEEGVTTAENLTQSHTLQIKSGTSMAGGEYTVDNDVWLKLDGYTVTQLTPVELVHSGGGPQDGASRFQLILSGFPDTADKYWNGNTVYIDGQPVSGDGVHYLPTGDGICIALYLSYSVIEADVTAASSLGTHILEIPSGTLLGSYVVNKGLKFQIDGESITPVCDADVTVTLSNDDSRNKSGGCASGFYFYVSPADGLASDVNTWSVRYAMTTGGIYVNDVLVPEARLIKLLSNLYYVAFDGCGITFAANDTVKISGTVTSGDYTVEYVEATFQYEGNGNWDIYTPPVGNNFALDTVDSGGWQGAMNRYLVWLTDDISGEKADPGVVQLLIDGQTQNVSTALIDGRYALILDASCGISAVGEHCIQITAGQAFGPYTVAADAFIYTHADGSITTEAGTPAPTEKTITLGLQTSDSGGWQAGLNRYIVWLTDDLTEAKVNPGTVNITVDGAPQTAETAVIENKFLLLLNASCGITATGNHTVIIHKDSYFGEYKVTEDVTIYTHADGSITAEAGTPTPTEKTITLGLQKSDPGGWQPGQNRYLVWLTDDLTEARVNPGTVTIMVDGENQTVETAVIENKFLLLLNASCGITAIGNHTVVIRKDSYFGEYKVTEDVTIYTHADGSVSDQPPIQIPEPSETVRIEDDIRNHQNDCAEQLCFRVSPADQLPYDLEQNTCIYGAADGGGAYFNGELISGVIIKKLPDLYYLNLSSVAPIQPGDVVTIDGVFGNADYAVRFEKQSFVYLGDGNWEIGEYLRDLREQDYTVQDISELKLGVSEFPLKPGEQTWIGDAVSSTNIAIQTKVTLPENMTEIKFGFSKINGMWDVEESGWQVSLHPATGEIKMFHDMSTFQAATPFAFTEKEYTVEIGSVNVDEYIDDVNQGLYCRKIFVKINGEEVLSYKDTNFNRNLGKKMYVYVSNDVDECKLVSLTSKGVVLRELTPTVYDYYDLSGFAGRTAAGATVSCIGTINEKSNYAVRMRMHPSTNASEINLAIGKVNPEQFWEIEESGWQLWMRPKYGQVFLAHSMSTWEVTVPYQYADSYTVEFGVKDQIVEKNGKYVSTVCRVLYVKINGEEIARWEDMDLGRTLGENVLLYCAPDAETELSTLNSTVTLPVEITVNGASVKQTEFVQVDSKVVLGKPSNIQVKVISDPYNKVVLNSVYCSGEKLEAIQENDGEYIYTLQAPAEDDILKIKLTANTLTVDEPEKVFDLFELSGQAALLVPEGQVTYLGMMVDKDGQAAVNSAIRYSVSIPTSFNHIPMTILGDNPDLWGNNGAMLEITPGQIHFCHSATSTRLESFSNALFNPGSTVCVEFGVVKCYENGIYKYDRWYVKAGKTEQSMELVGWYDSVERGSYGGHAVCYGVDFGGDYYLYSLKNTYSITDASTQENKDRIRTYIQLQKILPELYFTGRAEAYADIASATNPVQIKFFTQPGTSLKKLTVSGEDVTASVAVEDGAYCYALPSLTKDITFSYEIEEDTTKHIVSVDADDTLQVNLSQSSVITGGDVTVSVTAQPGYVPVMNVAGTDMTDRLKLDENTGVWTVTLKSVRADTQLQFTAQERNYTLVLTQPENGTVILGGDALNGKLPFGGRLELTLTPNSGCYIKSVTINGNAVAVDSNGKVVLEAVYTDVESLDIQAMFVQSDGIPTAQNAEQAGNLAVWIGIGTVAVIVLTAVCLLGKKKGKGRKNRGKANKQSQENPSEEV